MAGLQGRYNSCQIFIIYKNNVHISIKLDKAIKSKNLCPLSVFNKSYVLHKKSQPILEDA